MENRKGNAHMHAMVTSDGVMVFHEQMIGLGIFNVRLICAGWL